MLIYSLPAPTCTDTGIESPLWHGNRRRTTSGDPVQGLSVMGWRLNYSVVRRAHQERNLIPVRCDPADLASPSTLRGRSDSCRPLLPSSSMHSVLCSVRSRPPGYSTTSPCTSRLLPRLPQTDTPPLPRTANRPPDAIKAVCLSMLPHTPSPWTARRRASRSPRQGAAALPALRRLAV